MLSSLGSTPQWPEGRKYDAMTCVYRLHRETKRNAQPMGCMGQRGLEGLLRRGRLKGSPGDKLASVDARTRESPCRRV